VERANAGRAGISLGAPDERSPETPKKSKAVKASVGLPLGAIAASRSQTAVSGSAASFARQRPMPQRMSGACLAKINAPAPAREKPRALVTTQPRLVCP
jgi:LmbE family N-acetylglucosaminyl deacetylase